MDIVPIIEMLENEFMTNFKKYKINPDETIFKYKNNYFKLSEENGCACKNCDFYKTSIKKNNYFYCVACQTSNGMLSNYTLKKIDYYKILFGGYKNEIY